MLDTVTLTTPVNLSVSDLCDRGWTYHETRTPTDKRVKATLTTEEGPRLTFWGGLNWLALETSLPKLIKQDNAALIQGWDEVLDALQVAHDLAEHVTSSRLAGTDDGWNVSRLDPVWAWPTDPLPYLAALRLTRLPRTHPVIYDTSVSWATTRGHRIRGRCYDKTAEAGHNVELPLRLERQVRPRREVCRVNGERIPRTFGELTADHVVQVLTDTMQGLGLDRPIPTPLEARRRLVECHGSRRGRNLYRALRECHDFGDRWPSDLSDWSQRDIETGIRQAGITCLSWEGELPALEPPRLGFGGRVCPTNR